MLKSIYIYTPYSGKIAIRKHIYVINKPVISQ